MEYVHKFLNFQAMVLEVFQKLNQAVCAKFQKIEFPAQHRTNGNFEMLINLTNIFLVLYQ